LRPTSCRLGVIFDPRKEGRAARLEDAKVDLYRNWQQWLAWAELRASADWRLRVAGAGNTLNAHSKTGLFQLTVTG